MKQTLLSRKFWRDFLIRLVTGMAVLLFLDYKFTAGWKPTPEYFYNIFVVSIVLTVSMKVYILLKKLNLKY